jgi:hypothetical protein
MTSSILEHPELAAMAQVLKALQALPDTEARQRVVNWVCSHLDLNEPSGDSTTSRPKSDSGNAFADDGTPVLREGTINTVASKVEVKSCRTLFIAAAAYLTFYKGKEKFSREELVSCAKDARAWKSDYGVQTSINLHRMCDANELIEKSKEVYALSSKKHTELEQMLSE